METTLEWKNCNVRLIMTDTVFGQVQIRRGVESAMPALAPGELYFAEDTSRLFVGASSGNVGIGDAAAVAAELAAHLADAAGAHPASAISFAGTTSFAASNVQDALAELDSEKAAHIEISKFSFLGI
jgi:hypothetical protein